MDALLAHFILRQQQLAAAATLPPPPVPPAAAAAAAAAAAPPPAAAPPQHPSPPAGAARLADQQKESRRRRVVVDSDGEDDGALLLAPPQTERLSLLPAPVRAPDAATNANRRLWRFNRQIEKPRKTSKINHRPCPQKTAVTSKAARRRPPHDHRPRPVEVAFFRLFSSFFL